MVTTEAGIKLAPLTVNVIALLPAATKDGEAEEVVGDTLPTVNETAAEVPPPDPGLVAVTLNVPVAARSDVKMVAVS